MKLFRKYKLLLIILTAYLFIFNFINISNTAVCKNIKEVCELQVKECCKDDNANTETIQNKKCCEIKTAPLKSNFNYTDNNNNNRQLYNCIISENRTIPSSNEINFITYSIKPLMRYNILPVPLRI